MHSAACKPKIAKVTFFEQKMFIPNSVQKVCILKWFETFSRILVMLQKLDVIWGYEVCNDFFLLIVKGPLGIRRAQCAVINLEAKATASNHGAHYSKNSYFFPTIHLDMKVTFLGNHRKTFLGWLYFYRLGWVFQFTSMYQKFKLDKNWTF